MVRFTVQIGPATCERPGPGQDPKEVPTWHGNCPLLLHRYSVEAVKEKGKTAKNSAGRKSDNIESYVYRLASGEIGLPGSYLKGAIAGPNGAAKFRQDPRSSRKSALDLYRAGIIVLTDLARLGSVRQCPARLGVVWLGRARLGF